MKVIKMHGQGNDYIFFDIDSEASFDDEHWKNLSIKLSNRKNSIGADGIVLIQNQKLEKKRAICCIRIFNADGTEAETCGTALRCVTYYLYKKFRKKLIVIQTISGEKDCQINRINKSITVNMGKVIFEKEQSVTLSSLSFGTNDGRDDNDELTIHGYCLNIGNPHFVTFDKELENKPAEIWQKTENHALFPQKTNVEYVQILNQKTIRIKIWERGSGFTLACGSGACASAFLAHKIFDLKKKIKVFVPGGHIFVTILDDDSCLLSGQVSFIGEITNGKYR